MLDYVKTGNFIAQRRKNQGLTQKQLAERLALSDKTISKWETGRSAPDNSIMLELCNVLGISVNELLSGEEIPEAIYVERAEENFVELIKEDERRGARERSARAGILLVFLLLLAAIYIMLFQLTDGYRHMAWFLDGMSFGFVVGAAGLVVLLSGTLPDFARAFPICFGKKGNAATDETKTPGEIKQALLAVQTALSALPLSGVLAFVTGFILSASQQMSAEDMLSNMGVAMLTVFYGVLLDLLLLPVAVRLKRLLA